METVVAKLITGETVIGKYTDSHREFLDDVYLLMMMQTGKGEMGMNLVPYMMPFADKGSTIDSKFIMTTITPPKDLIDSYTQATTGIIIPKTNSILR